MPVSSPSRLLRASSIRKGALVIGAAAGVGCYISATGLKRLLGYDDSLDVFGVHCIGGIIGALLTGVFAVQAIGGTAGVLEGNFAQLPIQAYGVMATLIWSGAVSFILMVLLRLTIGVRVPELAEVEGLDSRCTASRFSRSTRRPGINPGRSSQVSRACAFP